MADRVIRAIITADATQANAEMQAASDRASAASAQAAEAMSAEAAAADASAEDITAAMAQMEADYAGAAEASGDMATVVDAAMADLRASLLTTDGVATTTAGDVAAAMQGVGTESEIAAQRMSASMAEIDSSLALASSDTAAASAEMSDSMDAASTSADAAKASFMGFSVETLGLVAVAGAVAGVGYESLKMADEFDKATNSLASDAGISQSAARGIGEAFLDASNTTIYSATDITSAYADVAGQLGSVQGKALDAAQAQMVMNAAQNLATATGSDLSSATSSLATVMQAYGQKANAAAADSNVLFNTARMTGQGVDTVQAAVQKLVAGLGVAAPPLGQVGGLLDDLAAHGETGRKSISAVTTAMNTLIKATQGTAAAQEQARSIFKQMPPSLQAYTKQLEDGQVGAYDYEQATEDLSTSQAQLASSFLSAESSVTASQSKLAEMGITVDTARGKFVGMASVIAQLHQKIQGESQAQALATIGQVVGTTAAQKLYATIEAGPAAYEKDVAAVGKANSAHEAASKMLDNLGDMWKEVITRAEDFGVTIGEAVMPVLDDLGGIVTKITSYFADNKNAVRAAEIILGALGVTLAVMVAPALIATAAGAWAAAAPFLLIAAPIIAVSAAFFMLYTNVGWFRDIVNAIIGLVGNILVGAFNVAKTAVGALVGAFETVVGYGSNVVAFFGDLPKRIKGALAGAATWLTDIGKQIIEGLIHGITGAVGDAVDAIKKVGSSIVNAAKSVLSIFSPSQVFSDIGANISAGLAQGIASSGDIAVSSTTHLMNQVAQAGSAAGIRGGGPTAPAGGGGPLTANFYGVTSGQDIVNELRRFQQARGSLPLRTTG